MLVVSKLELGSVRSEMRAHILQARSHRAPRFHGIKRTAWYIFISYNCAKRLWSTPKTGQGLVRGSCTNALLVTIFWILLTQRRRLGMNSIFPAFKREDLKSSQSGRNVEKRCTNITVKWHFDTIKWATGNMWAPTWSPRRRLQNFPKQAWRIHNLCHWGVCHPYWLVYNDPTGWILLCPGLTILPWKHFSHSLCS